MEERRPVTTRRSSSPVFFLLVIMGLAALVGMNVLQSKNTPRTAEQEEALKRAAEPSPSPVAPAAEASGGLSDPNALVIQPESAQGAPPGSPEIIVGFNWTPDVQGDPSRVTNFVSSLEKAVAGRAKVKVVNVDENPSVPAGISVNGKVIASPGADGSFSEQGLPTIMGTLGSSLSTSSSGGPGMPPMPPGAPGGPPPAGGSAPPAGHGPGDNHGH